MPKIKTQKPKGFYRKLKAAMKAKCEAENLTFGDHYADVLGFRGENAHIMASNMFNSEEKRLTDTHIALIIEDLGAYVCLLAYPDAVTCPTENELKDETLEITESVGTMAKKIREVLNEDENNDFEPHEAKRLLPTAKEMLGKVTKLYIEIDKTSHQEC